MKAPQFTDILYLQREFIRKLYEVLDSKDEALVELAKQLAAESCLQGKHNLAACGWGRSQLEHYRSLQLNVKRAREFSVCAEAGVLSAAATMGDEIQTIVTFHGSDEDHDEPYIVPPCGGCITRFQRLAPESRVIVEFEGTLVKLHQSALILIPYRP